jgi:phosphoserine phosphatase
MALGPFFVADKMRTGTGIRGTVLLMRHGETAWNRIGRVMGQHPVELDAEGRAQVEKSVPFARLIKPEFIVSSPLARARQSADIIAAGLGGMEVLEEQELEEVHYGRWAGMVFDELVDDPEYARYREHPLTTPTPGGETIGQVQERGVRAIRRTVEAHPGKRILFVSHGDIIRTVLCHFVGAELEHFRRIRIDNATFSAVQLIGDFAEVKFLNLLPDPERAFASPFQTKQRKAE